MVLGQKIKRARTAKGWSLEKLGDEMGVTRQAVWQWERFGTELDQQADPRQRLEELARVLEVPVDYFYDQKASEPLEGKIRRLLPHERKVIEAAIDGILATRADPDKAL